MTSSTRPKTVRKKGPAASVASIAPAPHGPDAVSRDAIALRAFELYCARGSQPGGELDDWLRAERELAAAMRKPAPRRQQKAAAADRTV